MVCDGKSKVAPASRGIYRRFSQYSTLWTHEYFICVYVRVMWVTYTDDLVLADYGWLAIAYGPYFTCYIAGEAQLSFSFFSLTFFLPFSFYSFFVFIWFLYPWILAQPP